MKTTLLLACLAVSSAFAVTSPKFDGTKFLGNPLLDHHFTADPTAVVYKGRLYVYGTNDHQQYENPNAENKNTYEKIKTLTIMSTADMVNWTYHGEIPVSTIAPWIINSWAPSIVSRKEGDGKTHFYLYFSNSGCGTAVLTATDPIGPWTSPLSKSLVDQQSTNTKKCKVPFDPGAAIAPDGTGYLAFGGAEARLVKLGSDLLSVVGEAVIPPAPYHFEANELNFIGDTCVYTYNCDWTAHEPWNYDCPKPSTCSMVYETSKTPLDPTSWKMGGDYNANPMIQGNTPCNNHTHLHKFKGTWYLIYHDQELQFKLLGENHGYRNINIDVCEVDEKNVTIKPCKNTKEGVAQVEKLNPYVRVEAETTAATASMTFKSAEKLGNMIAVPKEDGAFVAVRGVDFGPKGAQKFALVAKGAGRVEVRLDKPDGLRVATVELPDGPDFKKRAVNLKNVPTGVHDLFLVTTGKPELDCWQFAPAK